MHIQFSLMPPHSSKCHLKECPFAIVTAVFKFRCFIVGRWFIEIGLTVTGMD